MHMKEHIQGDVVVLSMKGDLMGEPETGELREKVRSLAGDGFKKIVLDVGGVRWINSSGLGALISALTTINSVGGDLRIAHINEKIENLFLITQLVKVFKVFETTERAIASFVVDPVAG